MADTRPVGSKVKESTLPGIGKKYVMPLEGGGHVALVVRPDGERRLFHFLEDEDQPHDVVKFERDEAQQLANLMGEALVGSPDLEKLDLALGQLEIEWVELDEESPLVRHSLGETRVRSRTGASVVAVMRGGEAVPNPAAEFVFRSGDTVLLVGTQEQCEAARKAVEG